MDLPPDNASWRNIQFGTTAVTPNCAVVPGRQSDASLLFRTHGLRGGHSHPDELACVGFVQEALNRFAMRVTLEQREQMFAY